MRRAAIVVLILLSGPAGCGHKPGPNDVSIDQSDPRVVAELGRFHGSWYLKTDVVGGGKNTADGQSQTVVFANATMSMYLLPEWPRETCTRYTMRIDPTANPKWFDLYPYPAERAGSNPLRGVYDLSADRLVLKFPAEAGERPTDTEFVEDGPYWYLELVDRSEDDVPGVESDR